MPEFRLQDGDFGADMTITFGAGGLYLPDPERPGLKAPVPLAEVAEIDSEQADGLRPVKDALSLGAMALLGGGSGALAAGFSSATKAKDVVFNVLLRDGRKFVAVANAKAYAELRSAHLEARREARIEQFADDMPHPADDIIAKYLNAADPSSVDTEPDEVAPPPVARARPPVPEPSSAAAALPERPEFGRRRRDD